MRSATAALLALTAALAGCGPALAQSSWSGTAPVFDSDARRIADQAEAEREARRKTQRRIVYPRYMDGGERPDIKPSAPAIVSFDRQEAPGSIIIDTEARKLYFVLPNKQAYEYPISVGREGFTWTGTERVSRIAAWPSWTPPPTMRKREPGLPITVSGGLRNPQGARALYLGNTIYRIHGTNNERTIGRANSSGCFRMSNEHVVHLASITRIGAKVTVLKAYSGVARQQSPTLFSLFGIASSTEPPPAKSKAKPVKEVRRKAKRPAPQKTAAAAPAAVAPALAAPTVAAPAAAAPTPQAEPAAASTAPEAPPAGQSSPVPPSPSKAPPAAAEPVMRTVEQ